MGLSKTPPSPISMSCRLISRQHSLRIKIYLLDSNRSLKRPLREGGDNMDSNWKFRHVGIAVMDLAKTVPSSSIDINTNETII